MSEIRTHINGSIGYTGTVKVTVLKNGKPTKKIVKHNAGTYQLMRALAESLIGKDRSDAMPQFIDAYQVDNWDESNNYANLSSGRLLVRSRVVNPHIVVPQAEHGIIPAECSATFVAYIPFSSLRFGADKKILGLGLFSQFKYSSDDMGLAYVELGEPILLENSGYAALVEWTLTLSNKQSREEIVI